MNRIIIKSKMLHCIYSNGKDKFLILHLPVCDEHFRCNDFVYSIRQLFGDKEVKREIISSHADFDVVNIEYESTALDNLGEKLVPSGKFIQLEIPLQ
jgi:hypothetical protein